MTTPRFDNFIGFILKWECSWPDDKSGQLSRDPEDPGGTTKWGIDAASHPGVDVVSLSRDDAVIIYFSEWGKNNIENMATALGEVYYNCCINCGTSRAQKLLAQASPGTALDFLDYQESFYTQLVAARPSLSKFLKGWLNRTSDLKKFLKL